MALQTNLEKKAGTLADMLVGADVFIGVSAPKQVTKEMVATMNKDAIIFACANPTPEIFPDEAKAGGGMVSATVNGKHEVVSLEINPEAVDPDDVEMLQDMVIAAINEAMRNADADAAQNMSRLTGGLNLGGLF